MSLRGLFYTMTITQLRSRHSVRTFGDDEIEKAVVDKLKAEITMINTVEPGLHFQLILNDSGPFDGFFNSYGMFKNACNYVACVIEPSYPYTYQRAGYYAQQVVMLAVSLGLGTCFVGGTFNAEVTSAQLRAGEKIPFLIALGYEDNSVETMIAKISKKMLHLSRKKVLDFIETDINKESIVKGNSQLYVALQAVECAPSAMNRQPVKIMYRNGEIKATAKSSSNSDMIDLGIAMYNFQAVWQGFWEWGNPALFIPDNEDF